MKHFSALLASLMLLLCASAACARSASAVPDPVEAPAPAAIRATGSACVAVPADMAVLTFTVSAAGDSVLEAQAEADELLGGLHAALTGAGIPADDLHTTCYGVETEYGYLYSKLGEREQPTGYTVTSDLVVRVRELSAIGRIIDLAFASGAQSHYALAFESSQASAAYDAALQSATGEAMRKASLLASAAGLTLGELASITELTGSEGDHPVSAAVAEEGQTAPLNGKLNVAATVEVIYNAN